MWALVLGTALFVPVHRLMWVLAVRRAEAKTGARTDDAVRRRLKRRTAVTAALVCYVFAVLYSHQLFHP